MKVIIALAATVLAGTTLASSANAQTAGNLLGAPVSAAGGALMSAAAAHAGIAPTVNQVSPTLEPVTDGVTNAIGAAGSGVSLTGSRIQNDGVQVGTGASPQPLVSVGASQPANQGTVAAVLNGH